MESRCCSDKSTLDSIDSTEINNKDIYHILLSYTSSDNFPTHLQTQVVEETQCVNVCKNKKREKVSFLKIITSNRHQ